MKSFQHLGLVAGSFVLFACSAAPPSPAGDQVEPGGSRDPSGAFKPEANTSSGGGIGKIPTCGGYGQPACCGSYNEAPCPTTGCHPGTTDLSGTCVGCGAITTTVSAEATTIQDVFGTQLAVVVNWATSPPAPVQLEIKSVADPVNTLLTPSYSTTGSFTYVEDTGGEYTVTVTPFGPDSNSCTPVSVPATFPQPGYIGGTWQQGPGPGPTLLANASNYLCWLTRVTGRFDGGGESVQVYQSGGYWYLGGSSEQVGVAGSAMCVPYDTFIPESGGVNNWTGSFYVGPPIQPGAPVGDANAVIVQQVNTWQSDAITIVDGMTGEFVDQDQQIQVLQGWPPCTFFCAPCILCAPPPPGVDQIVAIAETDFSNSSIGPNGVAGWAGTFFVGLPGSGFHPSFYGPRAGPASASEAGQYLATSRAGSPPQMTTMANANEAICYFSYIAGAFRGGGEYAEIYVNAQGYWVLEVGSGQEDGTAAEATCYAFDQSKSQAN